MRKLISNQGKFLLLSLLSLASACAASEPASSGPIKVEVVQVDGKYVLLRGGEPYTVKGAGFDYPDLQSLVERGGNSIRTWATDAEGDKTLQLLDQAQELGVTVSLCLGTGSERTGFDYEDKEAVARQLEDHRKEVLRYKDHPALLTWIIGNELNHDYTNPAVYDAVNASSRMIHQLDPNHPTTTTTAGFSESLITEINARAPDLDFISFQVYGLLFALPEFIRDTKFSAPFFVTEWGAIGHWEVDKTAWGAPLEQDSTEKAATYQRGYREVLEPLVGQMIGNYVFLWGQKQEKTPTWYGLFTETGEEIEVMDVMQHIWTGGWPENRAPHIEKMLLAGKTRKDNVRLKAGMKYNATVSVDEPENDAVRYLWQIKDESTATQVGGDYEAPIHNLKGLINNPAAAGIVLTAPGDEGAYRLFVYAYDGHGHAAHANIPFYVGD